MLNLLMTTGFVERRPRKRSEHGVRAADGKDASLHPRPEGATLRNAILPRCRDCCALYFQSINHVERGKNAACEVDNCQFGNNITAEVEMNILGWKLDEYELGYVSGKQIGYLFTIDGEPLEFKDFIPLSGYDIEEVDYLSDTQSLEDAPYLACCVCGIVGCDAVQTIVKFEGGTVCWSAFRYLYGKPTKLGEYCFDKTQYCQAIHSLLEDIKKNNRGH